MYGLVARVHGIIIFVSSSSPSFLFPTQHTNVQMFMMVDGTVLDLDPDLHYSITAPYSLVVVEVAGQFDGALDILRGGHIDLQHEEIDACLHTYVHQKKDQAEQKDNRWIRVQGRLSDLTAHSLTTSASPQV